MRVTEYLEFMKGKVDKDRITHLTITKGIRKLRRKRRAEERKKRRLREKGKA